VGSGVNDCPCCGTAVMVKDEFVPEFCDECAAAECDAKGPCLNDSTLKVWVQTTEVS